MRAVSKWMVLAAVVAAAAGCSHQRPRHDGRHAVIIHEMPLVTVKTGAVPVISVSPEPLVFTGDQRNFRIEWSLPAGLEFPDNGIVIEGQVLDPSTRQDLRPTMQAHKVVGPINSKQEEIVDCRRHKEDPRKFSCLNRRTKPGVFRYTIRVKVGNDVAVSDPTIMNE